MSNGFTMRVDDDLVLVSADDGRTWRLSNRTSEMIRAAAIKAQRGTPLPLRSTVAAATLAEAHEITPRPSPELVSATVEVGGSTISLGSAAQRIDVPFSDAVGRRRSARRFRSLGLEELATVLVTASRVQNWHHSEDGYQITARPAPSAGARHPCELELVVADVAGVPPGLWHYDPGRCVLVHRHNDDELLRPAREAVAAAGGLTQTPPVTIFLVAHMQRTLARYPAGATLVWRDAGVLAGLLHLAASAAGLSSCIIGTAGVLEVDRPSHVADVGALVLGRPIPGRK